MKAHTEYIIMIHHALNLLFTELEAYMQVRLGASTQQYVVQGNVAQLEASNNQGLERKVIISLVNIEEESTLKNYPNHSRTLNNEVRYENPPVYLNLYLLFTANFPPENDDYVQALTRLSLVIEFFQGRYVFNLNNAPTYGNNLESPDVSDMQLILNLYTMTFEQINHLWGSLGGKQIPFVMYKARMVRMLHRRQTGVGPLIEEITTNGRATPPQR
ncbi:MAG: DUF4255 domain-containing protein [Saprospiraceae bacterium]